MDRYPVCVIGVGPAGRSYLLTLKRHWRVDVVGFVNRSAERRNAVAQESGIAGFATLDELLAEAPRRPQMAVIATANPTHKDFAIQVLGAGLHCFCEKPMAMTLDDCQAMLDAERASGKILQIGFEYRYGTMTERLKRLQTDDAFGAVKLIDVVDSRGHWAVESPELPFERNWRLDRAVSGGPIFHCGIHQLDLMRYYGGEITRLQAFVPPHSLPFYPEGYPDQLTLQVRFANGAAGSFRLYHNIAPTWYRAINPMRSHYHEVPNHRMDITLTGTKGAAVAELYHEHLHVMRYDGEDRETVYERTETFDHHARNQSHHDTPGMIVRFVERLQKGLGAFDSAADALRTTKVGFVAEQAVSEAMHTGWASPVHDLEA